jgi:lipopolysaccharide biosynthesis protein
VIENPEEFNVFCDSIALIYHESRNVRHLLRKGLLNPEPWRFVVSLPTNRDDAWRDIAPLRNKARALSVDDALDVFKTRFHVSLSDLSDMFANENWRHAAHYGGNAWAGITKLAVQLAEALRSKDVAAVFQIASQLKEAQHNTGSVQGKIAQLEKNRKSRDA